MGKFRNRILFAAAVFGLPYAVIYSSGLPEWAGRAIGVSIFHAAVLGVFLWLALAAPNTLIRAGSRLAEPSRAKQRIVAEKIIRMALFGFVLFFTETQTLPLAEDALEMYRGGAPSHIRSRVSAGSGIPFFKQSVRLQTTAGTELHSYTFLYFRDRIDSGGVYDLAVAPRSRVILQARRLEKQQDRTD